jgi:hypothetical protein
MVENESEGGDIFHIKILDGYLVQAKLISVHLAACVISGFCLLLLMSSDGSHFCCSWNLDGAVVLLCLATRVVLICA